MISAKMGMKRDLKVLFFFHFAKGIKTYWGGVLKLSNSLFFFPNIFLFHDGRCGNGQFGYGIRIRMRRMDTNDLHLLYLRKRHHQRSYSVEGVGGGVVLGNKTHTETGKKNCLNSKLGYHGNNN